MRLEEREEGERQQEKKINAVTSDKDMKAERGSKMRGWREVEMGEMDEVDSCL